MSLASGSVLCAAARGVGRLLPCSSSASGPRGCGDTDGHQHPPEAAAVSRRAVGPGTPLSVTAASPLAPQLLGSLPFRVRPLSPPCSETADFWASQLGDIQPGQSEGPSSPRAARLSSASPSRPLASA